MGEILPDMTLSCTVCDYEADATKVPKVHESPSQARYICPDCGATKFREAGKEPIEMPEEPPANRRRRIIEANR